MEYRTCIGLLVIIFIVNTAFSQTTTLNELISHTEQVENKIPNTAFSYTVHSQKLKGKINVVTDGKLLFSESDHWILCVNPNYSFAIEKTKTGHSLLGVFQCKDTDSFEDFASALRRVFGMDGDLLPFHRIGRLANNKNYNLSFFLKQCNSLAVQTAKDNHFEIPVEMIVDVETKKKYGYPENYMTKYLFKINAKTLLSDKIDVLFGDPQNPNKVIELREYDPIQTIDGFHIPIRIDKTMINNGGVKTQVITKYTDLKQSAMPFEKMNLSYYGIPEPDFNSSPSRWPYYLIALVGLFTLGYFLFKRGARKS